MIPKPETANPCALTTWVPAAQIAVEATELNVVAKGTKRVRFNASDNIALLSFGYEAHRVPDRSVQ
jgi:hypothetical protein